MDIVGNWNWGSSNFLKNYIVPNITKPRNTSNIEILGHLNRISHVLCCHYLCPSCLKSQVVVDLVDESECQLDYANIFKFSINTKQDIQRQDFSTVCPYQLCFACLKFWLRVRFCQCAYSWCIVLIATLCVHKLLGWSDSSMSWI